MNPTAPQSSKKSFRWAWFITVPVVLLTLLAIFFGPFLLREARVKRIEALRVEVLYNTSTSDVNLLPATLRRIPGLSHYATELGLIRIDKIRLTPDQFRQVLRDVRQLDVPLFVDLTQSTDLAGDLAQLETLRVVYLVVQDAKMDRDILRRVGRIHSLEELNLTECTIDNQGMTALQDLKQLDFVSLDGSTIDDSGLAVLSTFPKLQDLSLSNTRVSDAAKEELCKKLPSLNLSDD